jgi:hypothetical protein
MRPMSRVDKLSRRCPHACCTKVNTTCDEDYPVWFGEGGRRVGGEGDVLSGEVVPGSYSGDV